MSDIPRNKNPAAPTPQNTPANAAPISSRAQAPGLSSLKEEDGDRAAAAALLAQNPKLVSMIEGRLQGLIGQTSGYIESLPAHVRRRVAGLKGIQKEHSKLEAQFQEEVLQLEKKFLAKYSPLYQKRAEIVNGKAEPSEEEIAEGEKDDEDEDGDEKVKDTQADDESDDKPVNGIPEFWLSAMKNHPSLAELITENDEGAMKQLQDIRMEYLDKPGFRLVFQFSENDYFSNKTISKTYFYQEEAGYGGDYIYDHAEGDKIDWKAGKDLTVKIEQKKQRNKNTKQTRIVKKTVPTDSFFNFFNPPKPPSDDEDEDIASDVEDRLELDYSLGEEIKEKIIPRAIDWFTGEALQFESLEDEELEGEFEDEDDEDEDDLDDDKDDEDDSDEDVDGPKGAKQDTSECKQS